MLQFPSRQPDFPRLCTRRGFLTATVAGWASLVTLHASALAQPLTGGDDEALRYGRQHRAAADLILACEWMAHCYEIPARVPQEMLLAGHSYPDTLIALALMAKGASLNELMELRAYHRWDVIAKKVELDPQTLPAPIQPLIAHGPEQSRAKVLHFLPDVYVGITRDLTINAFTPILPSKTMVERFKLNGYEIENIRKALEDPLGVPEELLLQTGGRGGLIVGDWVLAGVLTHHKPVSIEDILLTRAGNRLSWSETCLAFGMRPDVLTRGPLSGIYPLMTGTSAGTVLCARRRPTFPDMMEPEYDLQRLNKDQVAAIFPLLARCYRLNPEEQKLLADNRAELAEKGLMAAISRLAKVELGSVLDLRRAGNTYRNIVACYTVDLTGQDGVKSVIEAREPRGEHS